MDPLRTTELRYFIAVAEELHFGRAADRLGMAQPPLSRAIRALEDRLGVRLLERTSRSVTLTPAGEALLAEGRRALDAMAAAAHRAQRAGQPVRRLALAMKPGGDGGLLPGILAAYEAGPDAIPVDLILCGPQERVARLRTGEADVAFLHTPQTDVTGFDTAELLAEGQVVALPLGHRLATRDSVSLADLAGEPMPRPPYGLPAPPGPPAPDAGQLMQLVALGRAVAVVPESVRGYLRSDLTCVPVRDAPPTSVVLAWPQDQRGRALAAFVRTAVEVAQARVRTGPGARRSPAGT